MWFAFHHNNESFLFSPEALRQNVVKRTIVASNVSLELQEKVGKDLELMSEQKIRAIYSGKCFFVPDPIQEKHFQGNLCYARVRAFWSVEICHKTWSSQWECLNSSVEYIEAESRLALDTRFQFHPRKMTSMTWGKCSLNSSSAVFQHGSSVVRV